jgi:cob(I)alamin adenosyltransferase
VAVFAIGALDAYLSDVAAEVLVAQLERARTPNADARNLLRRILKEIDTLPFELALTTDSDERRRLAQEAISEHLTDRISNHGAKGVAATRPSWV